MPQHNRFQRLATLNGHAEAYYKIFKKYQAEIQAHFTLIERDMQRLKEDLEKLMVSYSNWSEIKSNIRNIARAKMYLRSRCIDINYFKGDVGALQIERRNPNPRPWRQPQSQPGREPEHDPFLDYFLSAISFH